MHWRGNNICIDTEGIRGAHTSPRQLWDTLLTASAAVAGQWLVYVPPR